MDKPSAANDAFIQYVQDAETYPPAMLVSSYFDQTRFEPVQFQQALVYCPPTLIRATRKRQAEYFAGRYLADKAMNGFGIHKFKLAADANRCPQWPASLVGSITHTDNYAACIAAKKSEVSAIGIDAQDILDDERAERLQSRIIDSAESSIIAQSGISPALGLSLCFSAKESIYKALYPRIQQYFGFNAAKLHSIDVDNCSLAFRFDPALWILHNERNLVHLHYQITEQRILTCLMLRTDQK